MQNQKVTFKNSRGEMLSGILEMPVNRRPYAYAIFAHCFTCAKNLATECFISRAITLEGIAVLRLDFTGLGAGDGPLGESGFSSSVDDLVAAGHFLGDNYAAPSLIAGHSLGGAAAICAAHQLPSVKAVATIGAPYAPEHITHLLQGKLEEIETGGAAEVSIGGRPFSVKKQFLEDIREKNMEPKIEQLGRALLILHSPQDRTVSIENAARLYQAARHPKSFISLDGSDHLVSNKHDALYIGEVIASWARRYLDRSEKEALKVEKQVAVRLGEQAYTTDVMVRQHSLTADEPESFGGNDFGPSPYELVAAGLGACTAMTLQMYARRKKWPLKEVRVHLDHYKEHAEDSENAEDHTSKIDYFTRLIELDGPLSEEQRERLLEIANKCPVHRTLLSPIRIVSSLK